MAEPMIARVVGMHATVSGTTAAGVRYSASDRQLLRWVHATASFGFAEAYSRYVDPLSAENFNAFCAEGAPVSRLYGAIDAPRSLAGMQALFESTRPRLSPSPIIFEFLRIMRETPAFPLPLRWLQPTLLRAAVELIPERLRESLGLSEHYRFRSHQPRLPKRAGPFTHPILFPARPAE